MARLEALLDMPRCKCGAHDWHPIHKNTTDNSWMYHEYEPWPEAIAEFVQKLENQPA